MADERDRVSAGPDHHMAVVKRHRVAVESLLDQPGNVRGVHVEDEPDLVLDIADTCQPALADSASARWLRNFTAPVSVRLPLLAVASTPSGCRS